VAEKLVVMPEMSQQSVEQYRKVAATLHQIQLQRGVKVVMVASALPGEGKTLTSANLALTLSESYRRRVLLIDADLRRPQLHEVFQVPNGPGLNEGLKLPADQRLSVIEMSPRLVLLPGGSPDPDPMSILTSDRMRRVVTEASASFDWVILDAPPIVPLPDTNLLAGMVDLAVLVIAAGRTPYNMIVRAVEILGRERIAGVVLNRVDESIVAANSGGTGGYYEGYGESAITQQS
jgi:capsular exopolysaccharide synthesis family protein